MTRTVEESRAFIHTARAWLKDSMDCRISGRHPSRHIWSFEMACRFTRKALAARLEPQRRLFV